MKKYVYILSQRYSGSTLLSFLLATHPEVSTIGERRKFYNKVIYASKFQHHKAKHCSCGELFKDCAYLNEIKDELLRKIDPALLKTNATEMKIYDNKYMNKIAYEIHIRALQKGLSPFMKTVQQHQFLNTKLVNTILEKDGTSVFLDSSKIINQAFYLSQIHDFDFYVIWLVRDPRAQVSSAIKHQQWSVEKAVGSWKKEMVNNARILKKFKIKNIKLSYADLCADPSKQMRKVFEFVGIDSDKFSLNFREQEQHIMGNYMRLQQDQKIVERMEWKDNLSPEQIAIIEGATHDYQLYYS